MKNKKLTHVDFHPDGRIVKHYEGEETPEVKQSAIKPKTPKEALQERLAEYKKRKKGER